MCIIAQTDLFATKGVEYLLVIGFLGLLAWFWRQLRAASPEPRPARAGQPGSRLFELPDDVYCHPGHAWARPAGKHGRVTIGVDDFAQKLIGPADSVWLPPIGARLEQGGPGCRVRAGGETLEVLSPVTGEVVARNEAVERQPDRINREPYGSGWLVEVRTPTLGSNLANLLRGGLAAAWLDHDERRLLGYHPGELGTVLQDGGIPVSGIARALSSDRWVEIARTFLENRNAE